MKFSVFYYFSVTSLTPLTSKLLTNKLYVLCELGEFEISSFFFCRNTDIEND